MFAEECRKLATEFPDVAYNEVLVDTMALKLVMKPQDFDVIVTTNTFGDILSDEAAILAGSMGMLPSASLGGTVGLYEPVHGSAPDIAGQGIANPIGAIWSGAMMFEHLGEKEAGRSIVDAIERTLAERTLRTRDLGGNADTTACGKAVAEMVD